jgi:hypothetical protein
MKNITQEIKLKILHNYSGCNCLTKISSFDVKQLIYIDGDTLSEKGRAYFTEPEILVSSLKNILKAHVCELAKILNDKTASYTCELYSMNDTDSVFKITYSESPLENMWIQFYYNEGSFSLLRGGNNAMDATEIGTMSHHILEAYQYLQSKGYALPYSDFSVNDLVNLGVYQLSV